MTRRRRGAKPPPEPSDDLGLFQPEELGPFREEGGRVRESDRGAAKRSRHAARSTQHAAHSRRSAPHAVEHDAQPESFPGESPRSAISVATLTSAARDVIEGAFMPLWVRGEVADFKAHRNGHWYFSLRDESALIRCVVWASDRRRIPAPPDDGMQVVALGKLTVFPGRGDMQLSIKALSADGDGLWRKALEQTIANLRADGLLAPERKREIPRHPSRIAVITSPDGAALHDIVAVVRRRCPHVEIVLVPAMVQGDNAPDELCEAIERVSRWGAADTLIIGRGGGGRDDLWAFNDERVARALAACPIPTISAVGHELDTTVCDLVADLRAPTPSAAAEAAVPERDTLFAELRRTRSALALAMADRLAAARDRLQSARRDIQSSALLAVERRRSRVGHLAGALEALSPLAVLSRGYAVAQDESGRTLARASQFAPGRSFRLVLRDGTVRASTGDVVRTEGAES